MSKTNAPTVDEVTDSLAPADPVTDESASEQSESAKSAEPKPGDPNYDWAYHYGDAQLYIHTYPDGQVVALRRFADIYSKQWLRSIRDLSTEFDIESAAVDRAACDVARTLIDNRPCPVGGPDDFDQLWKAWSKADDTDDQGGVSPGE